MKPAVFAVMFMVVFGHQVSSHHRHKELGEAVREFGRELQQKLPGSKRRPIVISPFSSHSSLTKASLGARNETAEEMERTLNYVTPSLSPSDAHDEYSEIFSELQSVQNVEVANAMFVNSEKTIKQSFKSQAQSKYLAKIDSFNASESEPEKKINDYVSEKTDGEIKEIIPRGRINEGTSVLLVSTLSFNSSWEKQFDESKTKKREFICENGRFIEVDMMNDNRTILRKRDNESNADVIRIPYKGGRFELFIALPQSPRGLADLESRLSQPGMTSQLLNGLKPAKVEVSIPTFKIASQYDLTESLRAMGIEQAFSQDDADFSGVSDSEKLYISNVFHYAELEVYERGTSSSAATVVEIDARASRSSEEKEEAEEKFTADHGFLYWLMDSSNKQTLFQGRFTSYFC